MRSPGLQFPEHFEQPPPFVREGVYPSDPFGGRQTGYEFFGLQLAQGTADVREVDFETFGELGGGFWCRKGQEDLSSVLPPNNIAIQRPHDYW